MHKVTATERTGWAMTAKEALQGVEPEQVFGLLAQARKEQEEESALADRMWERVSGSMLYKAWDAMKHSVAVWAARADAAKRVVADAGLERWMASDKSTKSFFEGLVGIRAHKKVNYDFAEALAWAREHNMALTLDASAFEKLVLATDLDAPENAELAAIAQVEETYSATVASKLPDEKLDALGATAEDWHALLLGREYAKLAASDTDEAE